MGLIFRHCGKSLEGNPRKEADESSYLIALPDGETEGPYTKEQMKALYRNGRLAGSLLCCKMGASSWEALETLIGKMFNKLLLLKSQEEGGKAPVLLAQAKMTRILI